VSGVIPGADRAKSGLPATVDRGPGVVRVCSFRDALAVWPRSPATDHSPLHPPMSENTSASEAGSDSVTDALTVAIEADGLVHDLRFLEDGFIKGVLETHLSHLPVDTVVTGSSGRDLREHLQEVVPEVLGDDIGIGFTFYPAIWFINDEGPRNAPSILKTPPANTSIEGYVEIREQGAEHFDRGVCRNSAPICETHR